MLLYQLVDTVFDVMIMLIIVRCVLSFVRHDPYQPVIRFIYDATEPIMAPFRRLIPSAGGIDFSPMVVWMVLMLVRSLMLGIMLSIG